MATPRSIFSAVSRIWDPDTGVSPTSERIVQDTLKVLESSKKIVQHGGGIVPGLANRNGHRNNRCQDENTIKPKKKPLNKKR